MSILSSILMAAGVMDAVNKGKDVLEKTTGALPKDLSISDSYISYTKPFVINPVVLIDETLQFDENLIPILGTANLVFASFYTMAVKGDSTLGRASVRSKLDKFNPDRSGGIVSFEEVADSKFMFTGGLPAINKVMTYGEDELTLSAEEIDYAGQKKALTDVIGKVIDVENNTNKTADPDNAKIIDKTKRDLMARLEDVRTLENAEREDADRAIRDASRSTQTKDITPKENKSLFLGRTYQITLQEGHYSVDMDVVIRLMSNVIERESLIHMLSLGKFAYKASARIMKFLAGDLSFIDLFLCRDILDAHRKTLKNDKSGIYREITGRGLKNAMKAAKSKQASVGTNSGIAVISADMAKDVEFNIGGSLETPSVRDRIFSALNLMLLFVYDPVHGYVVMYQRGLALPTETTIRELKSGSEGSSKTDVTELFNRIASGDKLF